MKLAELNELYRDLEAKKKRTHEEMKEVRRKISKYAAVLKHAQEIESVEHTEPEKV